MDIIIAILGAIAGAAGLGVSVRYSERVRSMVIGKGGGSGEE